MKIEHDNARKKIDAYILKVLYALLPKLTAKHEAAIIQFVKFVLVGATNSVIYYALNVFVLFMLRNANITWDYIAGNGVAFLFSVLWSFYWNNNYVFTTDNNGKRIWWKALMKTYFCYGFTGIILNNFFSWIWITKLNISKYIAPLINLIINVPVNYIINKHWAFRDEEKA